MSSLDLGVIGNCSYGALIDSAARIVWCCLPRFDADPVFCNLLNDHDGESGVFAIDLEGMTRSEQSYQRNTAILVTRLYDDDGNGIEITDFAPRFRIFGRRFRPMTLIRRAAPIAGSPRICVRLRPRFDYGAKAPALTHGSPRTRRSPTSGTRRRSAWKSPSVSCSAPTRHSRGAWRRPHGTFRNARPSTGGCGCARSRFPASGRGR